MITKRGSLSLFLAYLSKENERVAFILAAETRLGCSDKSSLQYNEPESSVHHRFAFSPSQMPQGVATVTQDCTTQFNTTRVTQCNSHNLMQFTQLNATLYCTLLRASHAMCQSTPTIVCFPISTFQKKLRACPHAFLQDVYNSDPSAFLATLVALHLTSVSESVTG